MKVADAYSSLTTTITGTEISSANHYTIQHGLDVPEAFVSGNPQSGERFSRKLLKPVLDQIIKETPLRVLPFTRDERAIRRFVVRDAKVTSFEDDFPRQVELRFNGSLECVDTIMDDPRPECSRAIGDKVVVGFYVADIAGDKHPMSVTIYRFHM